jgi:hypothetical protein
MVAFEMAGPAEAPDIVSLRPARFKNSANRFLKEAIVPLHWGEVGSTIEVTLSPDARRAGWDDWVGVLYNGTLIGWVSASGEQTRPQLCAIRDFGYEVVTTATFDFFQGVRSLCVDVPKPPALASWLEWRRPVY